MATRTFKIGEYARGGIITAEVKGTNVTIIGKEWDFSGGSTRKASQKNAKEFTRLTVDTRSTHAYRDLHDFLNDLTSYGWAEKVMEWVESKLPLDKTSRGILNTMNEIDSKYGINF